MPKAARIMPISDLRQNAGSVVRNISSSKEPVFITQSGRPPTGMVSMRAYEESQHELDILRLLAHGKKIEAGAGYEIDEVLNEGDRFNEI